MTADTKQQLYVSMVSAKTPLLAVLKKIMIIDLHNLLNDFKREGRLADILGPSGAKLAIMGSSTLASPFRNPDDVDMRIIDFPAEYDPETAISCLRNLTEEIVSHYDRQNTGFESLEMDTTTQGKGYKQLIEERGLIKFYLKRSFTTQDVRDAIHQCRHYSLTQKEVSLLQDALSSEDGRNFDETSISNIAVARLEHSKKSGTHKIYEAEYGRDNQHIEVFTAIDGAVKALTPPAATRRHDTRMHEVVPELEAAQKLMAILTTDVDKLSRKSANAASLTKHLYDFWLRTSDNSAQNTGKPKKYKVTQSPDFMLYAYVLAAQKDIIDASGELNAPILAMHEEDLKPHIVNGLSQLVHDHTIPLEFRSIDDVADRLLRHFQKICTAIVTQQHTTYKIAGDLMIIADRDCSSFEKTRALENILEGLGIENRRVAEYQGLINA